MRRHTCANGGEKEEDRRKEAQTPQLGLPQAAGEGRDGDGDNGSG
jgi:hypothetical protein